MTPTPVSPTTRAAHEGRLMRTVLAAALVLAFVPRVARAQGFGVYEQSACAMGRGSAVVASPCRDGSSLFFNPAGLAGTRGLTVAGGATGILAIGQFTTDLTGSVTKMDRKLIPVPHAYVTYGINDRVAVGLGLFTPYGLETAWPKTSDAAFLGYDTRLHSFYLEPAAAVRLGDRVRVGAGLTFVMSKVDLHQLLDLSTQSVPGAPAGTTFGMLGIPLHTAFADASLPSSTTTGWGANFGLLVDLTDRISFGARYLTRVTLDYSGTAAFDQVPTGIIIPSDLTLPDGTVIPAGTPLDAVLLQSGIFSGPLATQGIKTSITMPDQLVLGLSVRPTDRLELEGDYYWTHWSMFDSLQLKFQGGAGTETRIENYKNTSGVRLGGQLAVQPGLELRAGYVYNPPAVPAETVTPLLPGGRRSQFDAGVSWRIAPRWQVDLSYAFLLQQKRRGRVFDPLPGQLPSTTLNSGEYQYLAHLFAATFSFHL